MKRSHILICVLLGLGVGLAATVQAKPDFSASEIVVTKSPVLEGEIAHFQLLLRNRGDAPAEPVQLRIPWPSMGHVIEVTGVENTQSDPGDQTVTASLALPAGSERVVDVAVLAPRDSGGRALSLSAHLIHFHSMAETWLHQTVTIDTRPRTDGLHLGRLRIAPAGVATLSWLFVTLVALLAIPRISSHKEHSGFVGVRAGVFALMIALGFWLIFAAMAWRDYRVLYVWPETTGTIVGRRVQMQSVSSSQSRPAGTGGTAPSSDIAKPEFALRYLVNGQMMLSTGYDTGSSLRVGGGKVQLAKEFQEWAVGKTVPCWYNPDDPADVVLKRGFGGAYLFALLPLFPFWIGCTLLRRSFSGER